MINMEDYMKAYRSGKKEYLARQALGKRPTLEALDEIMTVKTNAEVSLGLVQMPIEQIVGTRTAGRAPAFAANFMPILEPDTEFAMKWQILSDSHLNEGIREPVKAYEYMNKFYVQEGNKRVSVLKYYDAVSVPGYVTRILPPKTEDLENKIYYEFVDFYDVSQVNYIWFTKEGSFPRLQRAVGKEQNEAWNEEDKLDFSSLYNRFLAEYKEAGGEKLSITPGDALLSLMELYGYRDLCDRTTNELKNLIIKSFEEFRLLEQDNEINLQMAPQPGKKKTLIQKLLPSGTKSLKIAFLYAKTPGTSAWTYAHELGRLHLEQKFSSEVSTICYENLTPELAEKSLRDAINRGCNLIFATTPSFVQACVKAAIDHPEVRILDCSLNMSHRYIRTYYARMHEAKFLMGAIAGAMCESGKLGYIADYPLFGTIANINAYALGAKMINPRSQIYLEWSTLKDSDMKQAMDRLYEKGVRIVSGRDMVIPEESSPYFGLYRLDDQDPKTLAMPVWDWGKFYERLIRSIMNGTWNLDDDKSQMKAINYWWGLSSGVVDVICSNRLPIGTKRLSNLLKDTIIRGEFEPFAGKLYSQTGVVQADPNYKLSPEEIVKMDWLAENIVGSIPTHWELNDQAQAVTKEQGVESLKLRK